MRVAVPKEHAPRERRVAVTPETVGRLARLGFETCVEAGAGVAAHFPDAAYQAEGAQIVSADEIWRAGDVVLKVRPPSLAEVELLAEGATLVSFLYPADNPELLARLAARKITALGMDQVPRISRAQKLDALSSMANIAGYKAVILAADAFGGFFTGQITAAGKVPPAKVLVIGAGVAGLAAIGAAKGLGAVVRAFDTRLAVREQIQSMGAQFLELDFDEDGEGGGGYAKVMSEAFIRAEMDLFYEQAKEVDIVITTALIPGRPAPRLWERRAVEAMKPGSVVVDLAAERGGNCELTVADAVVEHQGVKIIGFTDLPSRLAGTASTLYGNNLAHLLDDMGGAAGWRVDLDDEVVRGSLVTHEGEITWPPPKPTPAAPAPAADPAPAAAAVPAPAAVEPSPPDARRGRKGLGTLIGVGLALAWLGARFGLEPQVAEPATVAFLQHLTVFALAVFVGWQVIWSVTAALHTPLMSVTNAISGIIVVGGMLQLRGSTGGIALILAVIAVLLATVNVAGGFLVTQRMLKMFRRGPG